MKPVKLLVALLCFVMIHKSLFSQDKIDARFGVLKTDFSPSSPVVDSGSEAVVLMDVGSTDIQEHSSGDFSLVYKRHRRILLKSKNSFEDLATVKLSLYVGNEIGEDLKDFDASTFNLENGQIVETKLTKSSIYKEKFTKYLKIVKFSFPNIREGSIIEYSYTIKSPYHGENIPSWSFQGKYPVIWSQYEVSIPPVYKFEFIKQGFLPYAIDTSNVTAETNHSVDTGISSRIEIFNYSGKATWAKWAVKDAPSFKDEIYLSSSSNYISRIRFYLKSVRVANIFTRKLIKGWPTVTNDLLADRDFGRTLTDSNRWCEADLKKVIGTATGLSKAKKIYEFVRDSFTCTNDEEKYLSDPLKKIFTDKKGSVADINLLLTALLINQGFAASPIILSTRDNGRPNMENAILSQYNYVISELTFDSVNYLLDAAVPRLGFDKLPEKCYNGFGRLIDSIPYLVPLTADSIKEGSNTFVFISNDDSIGYSGYINSKLGYYRSLEVREKLTKIKQDEYSKEFAKQFPAELELYNMTIDSLDNKDEPIVIKNDMRLKFDDDVVYFIPVLGDEAWKHNPFSAAARLYPVEMPYCISETYVLNMEVPKGYKIDEIPKSARVKLNENEGLFEYLIGAVGQNIQLQCRLILNKANFMPEDYQTLRDFFAEVVKKESEEIVFKKIQ